MPRFTTALGIAAALAAPAALVAPAYAGNLTIGSPAPPLKVAKWVKGAPITAFAKGKVYVVEFWATWCGPCRTTIPHLTELAKKHKGKVSFAGISISENDPAYVAKVEKFVKQMGAKMDYAVAVDDKPMQGFMAKNWMDAANQDGIPTAFIVDQSGKIAWIGHPMEMETPLAQIVAGTFNPGAEAAKRAEAAAKQTRMRESIERIQKLLSEKKMDEALAEMDRAMEADPDNAGLFAQGKFQMLQQSDEAKLYIWVRQQLDGTSKNSSETLNMFAWEIATGKLKAPDYDLALACAVRASELTSDENPMILDTLAYCHFKKGNVDKAIEIQEKAIKLLPKLKISGEQADQMKAEITGRLAEFKKAKQ